jgi:hypothetical protein
VDANKASQNTRIVKKIGVRASIYSLLSALSIKVSDEDGTFGSGRMGTGNYCDVLA